MYLSRSETDAETPSTTSEAREDMLAEKYPYIDEKDGTSRVMGNKTLYLKLLGKFTGRQSADELIGYMADRDYMKIMQSAHTLKGLSANLGLSRLYHVVMEIEALARENEDVTHLIAALDETVNETLEAIGRLL